MVGVLLRSAKKVVGAGDVGTSNGIDKIGFAVGVGVSVGRVNDTGRMVGVRSGALDGFALSLTGTDTGDKVNVVDVEPGAFCCFPSEFLLLLLIVGLDDGSVVG